MITHIPARPDFQPRNEQDVRRDCELRAKGYPITIRTSSGRFLWASRHFVIDTAPTLAEAITAAVRQKERQS